MAVISFLSRFCRSASCSGSGGGVYEPKLRSGDVLTPARRETIVYELTPSGGVCFPRFCEPSKVLAHFEMARRVEYGMVSLGSSEM